MDWRKKSWWGRCAVLSTSPLTYSQVRACLFFLWDRGPARAQALYGLHKSLKAPGGLGAVKENWTSSSMLWSTWKMERCSRSVFLAKYTWCLMHQREVRWLWRAHSCTQHPSASSFSLRLNVVGIWPGLLSQNFLPWGKQLLCSRNSSPPVGAH